MKMVLGNFVGISGKRDKMGNFILFCSKCGYIFNTKRNDLVGIHLMLCANSRVPRGLIPEP